MQDNDMPKGWHQIKSILIKEIQTASTFQQCINVSDALSHARFIGVRIAKANKRFENENTCKSPAVDS